MKTRPRALASLLFALFLAGCGYIEIIPKDVPRGPVMPEITNRILALITAHERGTVSTGNERSDSLATLGTLRTPAGFRLRLRYQELGVSLLETLKMSKDKDLLSRMVELAQWSQDRRVRSESLVSLATFSKPSDLQYFRTALSDQDMGIRFAAIEAVQRWAQAGSTEFLRDAMLDAWSPLIRVFAAQATLSLGNEEGIPVLIKELDNPSWVVRALAANYLGDFGRAEDSNTLLLALNRETQNDFVVAELSVALLKLTARYGGRTIAGTQRVAAPPSKAARAGSSTDNVIEMEPLVLQPPRLQIPDTAHQAHIIDQRLLQLITTRLGLPLDPALQTDSNYQDLSHLVTPEGFALQTRYSELGVAVAEGLAGTTDPVLRGELKRLAETARSPVTRATALLSLAYSRSDADRIVIESALGDSDPVVRFGALEAAQVGRYRIVPALQGVAAADPVPAFRLYAIQVLLTLNEPSAYSDLTTNLDNQDWIARAMAFWYLGRYGHESDYTVVMNGLAHERNDFVIAEATLAAQRLAPPEK